MSVIPQVDGGDGGVAELIGRDVSHRRRGRDVVDRDDVTGNDVTAAGSVLAAGRGAPTQLRVVRDVHRIRRRALLILTLQEGKFPPLPFRPLSPPFPLPSK